MAEVLFTNGVTFAAGAEELMNPEIRDIFMEDYVSYEYPVDVLIKLGYVRTTPLNPNDQFSIKIGAYELEEIEEGATIPEGVHGKGNQKGYDIQTFSKKFKTTKLMDNWLRAGKSLEGADSSVKKAYVDFAEDVEDLRYGLIKTKNQTAVRVLTEGWDGSQANGAGSPTPYGQPLFSAAHPYGSLAVSGTFRNILGGSFGTADAALTASSLQNALDLHKAELRLQNGDRVATPSKYMLFVSRVGAVNARQILNTPGNQVGMYSGDTANNNSNVMNVFSFNGNIVEIVELPTLGQTTQTGSVIGSDDYWFLINSEMLARRKGLRYIPLMEAEIDMWEDKNTKNTWVSIYSQFTFDHFGAEAFCVGSRGTA